MKELFSSPALVQNLLENFGHGGLPRRREGTEGSPGICAVVNLKLEPMMQRQKDRRHIMAEHVETSADEATPPFDASRGLEAFAPVEVLTFEGDGRKACVLGTVAGADALVALEQRAAHGDAASLVAALPRMALTLTNYSGAEYSYYDATDAAAGARYAVEAIWPASARQVGRKRPSALVVVEETAACYARVVEPFARRQATKCGWIDAVCSLAKERERRRATRSCSTSLQHGLDDRLRVLRNSRRFPCAEHGGP
jgi:hypothetical protein